MNHFNYHGIQNALCGKSFGNGGYFWLKRLTVIQMTKESRFTSMEKPSKQSQQ